MAGSGSRRWPRRLLFTLAALALVVAVVRIVADPLAARATRRALAQLDDYHSDFARVHVRFFPPGSVITRLELRERSAPRGQPPALYVERAESSADWRGLLRGEALIRQQVTGIKATIARPLGDGAGHGVERLARRLPELLHRLPRGRVERMEITDGELLIIDTSQRERPRLWLWGLHVVTSNMVTRPDMNRGRPMITTVTGRVQRSGRLQSRLSVPQGGSLITFELRTALEGLALSELSGLLRPHTDLQAPRGTLSSYARVTARQGHLGGWIRVVTDDVEVRPTPDAGPGDRVKAWLADKSVELFSDDDKGDHGDQADGPGRMSFTLPIAGRIDPDRPLLSSLSEVLRSSLDKAVRQALAGRDDQASGQRNRRGRSGPRR